ncbi:MAG TPA: multicopper oxidase domain-containing protein [Anaeromyxobacter sp.]
MKAIRSVVPLVLALALPAGALAFPGPQTPIAGSNIPQFKQALPLLSIAPQNGTFTTIVSTHTSFAAPLQISMCEFQAKVLPPGTFAPNVQPLTWVWGYIPGPTCPTTPQDTYLGPVLVNVKNVPTTLRFTNSLPTVDKTNVFAYKYSTDQTLHWADPLGGEQNMCHMASGDPPQVNVGIPLFDSMCSFNFGEDPRGFFNPVGIPAVPHLHGGEVPPVLDGGPDAWFTSLNANGTYEHGHDYYTNPRVTTVNGLPVGPNEAVYSYPNSQGQAPLWFHDHTLGATRLNVYAGIAGAYYLIDPAQESLDPNNPGQFEKLKMRPLTELIPIVLQDRMFDTNGQLFFPNGFPGGINGPPTNPQHPYWNPEFIGDSIVINGKVWPFLNVEPRRYRFLFLNGSNARTYEMFFVNPATKVMGPVMWVIGNDGGILDWPSIIDPNAAKPVEPHFIIMPGERYEMIVDFSGFAGQNLVLKNVAKAPYPGGATPQGTTTGQLMQFRVAACPAGGCPTDGSYDPALNQKGMPGAVSLRPTPVVRLTNAQSGVVAPGVTISKTRQLTLNEVALLPQTTIDPVTGLTTAYPGGPVEILVNNTLWSGKNRPDFQPVTIGGITEYISETPKEGDIELWEIVNTTADAHPIHTHLATFQVLNRQSYGAKGFMAAYAAGFTTNLPAGCTAGLYCPAYGPPYDYDPAKNPLSGGKWGGNPDVTPYLANAIQVPDPDEVGWKDTFLVYPGMVNRMLVRFAPTETPLGTTGNYPFSPNDGTNGAVGDSHGYVWHCHIIDHEDNEMMRQHVVVPLALPDCPGGSGVACRNYVKGTSY